MVLLSHCCLRRRFAFSHIFASSGERRARGTWSCGPYGGGADEEEEKEEEKGQRSGDNNNDEGDDEDDNGDVDEEQEMRVGETLERSGFGV